MKLKPSALADLLTRHGALYPHLPSFTVEECSALIDDRSRLTVDRYQAFVEALRLFGYHRVDRHHTSVHDRAVYDAVHHLRATCACPYCNGVYETTVLYPRATCTKNACVQRHLDDTIRR